MLKIDLQPSKLSVQFKDGTTADLEVGGMAKLSIDNIIKQTVDSEMRKMWDLAINAGATYTMTCEIDKDNEFFKQIIEEHRKYNAMTPKERTLYHTSDRFDTIVCPNSHVRQLLIEEFGELNYVVSNSTKDVVLADSRVIIYSITSDKEATF